MIRKLLVANPVVVAFGLVVGATSVVASWAPLAAMLAVALLWVSLYRPAVPIALAFVGILLDARGLTGVRVLGIPLTLSKMMVGYAMISHAASAMVLRQPLFARTPVTSGLFLMVCAMLVSLVPSVDATAGYVDVAGTIMLIVMFHVLYTTLSPRDLPWLLRFMSLATVMLLVWTALTQRAGADVSNAELAWWDRPSGAYGDPNAWSTCLLVVCPVLIGWQLTDKHWTAKPLLLALGVLFPFGIVQAISRAGLVAFALISPGLLYLVRKERTILAVAAGALVLLLPVMVDLDAAMLRYQTLLDPTLEADLGHGSLQERSGLLQAGIQIFLDHPWTGVGVGMFRMYAAHVSAGEVWKIAHNSYVNVAAEQGIQGLIAHGILGWQAVVAVVAVWNRSHTEAAKTFGLGLVLAFAAFGAMAVTLNLATFAVAWYVLAVGLAVGRHAGSELPRMEPESAPMSLGEESHA